MLYKAGPKLFIVDWLSRHNHSKNRDEEIPMMSLNINAIETCADIPECIMAEEIRYAILEDD